jgi:hypothetical protein
MDKIIWTNRVENEDILHGAKEKRNILLTAKRRKANCIGHMLSRNCLQKNVIDGKREVMER